jgi:hypothetical protein
VSFFFWSCWCYPEGIWQVKRGLLTVCHVMFLSFCSGGGLKPQQKYGICCRVCVLFAKIEISVMLLFQHSHLSCISPIFLGFLEFQCSHTGQVVNAAVVSVCTNVCFVIIVLLCLCRDLTVRAVYKSYFCKYLFLLRLL